MTTINQLSSYDNPQSGDQVPVYSANNGDARKTALSVLATWFSTAFTSLTTTSYVKVTPVTVANLPSPLAAGAGARAFVTDATSTTFHALVAGGGANSVPVFVDGTQWRVG